MTNPIAWYLKDLENVPKNGIKVFSTFACGGGSTMGYKLAGCEVIGANDIDPEMAYHYKLNHHPKYYFLCSIKDLLKMELPSELFGIDILEGSPPCFAKGTPVITSEGVKPIEQIKNGDLVLTHKGRWKPVVNTMTRLSETVWLDNRIETTPDHRFYAKSTKRKQNQVKYLSKEADWVEAKDCQGKFLGLPVEIEKIELPEPPERFTYNESFWYFVGRWIGDGWVRREEGTDDPYKQRDRYVDECKPCLVCGKDSRPHSRYKGWWTNYCSEQCRTIEKNKRKRPKYEVLICSSFQEADSLYLKLSELNIAIGRNSELTTERFRISSKSLVIWLMEYFGRYADGKNLPGFIYSMNKDWKNAFLQGYVDSDGHLSRDVVKLTSIGRNLMCGMMQLAITMGYSITIQPRKAVENHYIENRLINGKPSYCLSLSLNNRYVDYSDNIQWRKLRRPIRPASELTQVYDIEVADDHSFVADGFIVHNCSSFSMAGSREKDWGKEKHFREGQAKQVLDDLFFDYLNLVERLKPKVAIAENVKGMIQGNAKWYVKQVFDRFKEIGYRPQLFLVNAADCGVPQKRERVFFCALRNDIDKPKLVLAPKHRWISTGEATSDLQELTDDEIRDTKPTDYDKKWYHHSIPGDGSGYATATTKLEGKRHGFNHIRLDDKSPSVSLTAQPPKIKHWTECRSLTYREWKRLGSFPDDYQAKTDKIGKYMIGMNVPPRMMEQVAKAVIEQWLS